VDSARIVLASQSPRRRELLRQIGVSFETVCIDIDERPLEGERADALATRLAIAKAQAGRAKVDGHWPVLGADTVVVIGDRTLGKPENKEQAVEMLQLLGGRIHRVITAVALQDQGGDSEYRLSVTRVGLRVVSSAEARAYWETGEPRDKAGGYAIQGLGAVFVDYIEGSFSGVVGLPLFETADLLRSCGISAVEPGAGDQPAAMTMTNTGR